MSQQPTVAIQSWPLSGVSEDGSFSWSTDDQSIRETILNILLTSPGERIQRPDFGAGLLKFVHQPNNETTRNLIAGVIKKSLDLWEPRIVIDGVDVQPGRNNIAEVHITIRYKFRHSQLPAELGLTLNMSS